jgi:hypothetical protein
MTARLVSHTSVTRHPAGWSSPTQGQPARSAAWAIACGVVLVVLVVVGLA